MRVHQPARARRPRADARTAAAGSPGAARDRAADAGGGGQAYGLANLIITKRASPRRVRLGGLIRFTIEVVNRGPDPAENVTILDEGSARPRGRLPLRPEGRDVPAAATAVLPLRHARTG